MMFVCSLYCSELHFPDGHLTVVQLDLIQLGKLNLSGSKMAPDNCFGEPTLDQLRFRSRQTSPDEFWELVSTRLSVQEWQGERTHFWKHFLLSMKRSSQTTQNEGTLQQIMPHNSKIKAHEHKSLTKHMPSQC